MENRQMPAVLNRFLFVVRTPNGSVSHRLGSVRFVNMNGSGSVPMFPVRFAVRGSVPEPHCPSLLGGSSHLVSRL